MTLTFNPMLAMAMTYSHAKVQGQRSVGFEDTRGNKRTDRRTQRRTEAIALPPTLMWPVKNNIDMECSDGQMVQTVIGRFLFF